MAEDSEHYHRERQFWDRRGTTDYTSLSAYDQRRVADWLNWCGGGRVLDIGGGAGMVSRVLAGSPKTDFVCVDISYNMLRNSPVPSVQADALKLPFCDASFDLIIAAAFVHHIPGNEEVFFRECNRVAKPNGRIVGYDPNAKCIQNRLFMGGFPWRLRLFSPDERPVFPQKLGKYLLSSGFSDYQYFTMSFRNQKLTFFELVQRYMLNPLAIGPARPFLDRWFYWEARK